MDSKGEKENLGRNGTRVPGWWKFQMWSWDLPTTHKEVHASSVAFRTVPTQTADASSAATVLKAQWCSWTGSSLSTVLCYSTLTRPKKSTRGWEDSLGNAWGLIDTLSLPSVSSPHFSTARHSPAGYCTPLSSCGARAFWKGLRVADFSVVWLMKAMASASPLIN